MKKELQRNVNAMTSGGGSIQHPLSIHSASIGSRWKVHGLSLMMTILLLFTMGIGQMWGAWQTTTVDATLGTRDSISTDGLTREWSLEAKNLSANDVSTSNTALEAHNAIQFMAGSSGKQKFVKATSGLSSKSNSNIYIPVPIGSAGTITMSVYSDSEGRWLQLYTGKTNTEAAATKRMYSKQNATPTGDSGKEKGPRFFSFTATDTTMINGVAYLHFKDNNTEMKISGFSVVLTTGSYPTAAPSCAAGAPGNITKGTLSAGVLTLNAAGSAASGDTWYWQTAADGTSTANSGSSFDVSAADTYYIRSYNTAGECWSDAKSFEVKATDLVANYTVIYKDGTTELGSETVEVGHHPTGSEIAAPTKDCYTFAGWDPALSGVSGSDGDEIEVNATWTGNYFTTSVDFEKDGESAVSGIASKNIVASNAGSYDAGKESENWAYKGWKIKSNGATVKVLVQANKKLTYKFGYLAATAHVNITNDAITREVTGASKEEGNPLKYTTYSYIKDYDAVYTFTTGSADAAVIKALSVEAVYTAYYEDVMGVVTLTVEGNVTQVTLPTPSVTTKSGKNFIGWKANKAVTVDDVVVDANTLIAAGKIAVLGDNTTFTTQWVAPANFDVKFYQGYGEPDVQIGETQSISTGGHAVAPADPTRTGFAFLGWSYDATEAHIVDVAAYGITAATDFTAMWKAVWTVTFDGAGNVNVENGETVASPDSPTQAGKVFQGWYNGESKYDFSATVTGNLALTSKWADADPNHYVYAYNDDFHFDGVVYKTPEGKTKDPEAAEASNVALATNPYTLFSGTAGITSIIATNGIYDYKKAAGTKHITAYLKLKADDATSNVVFTIASGYTAVLKLKMNGYSSNATISLKKGDDAVIPSGTQEGTAEGKNYGELTYNNLAAGEYKLTTANKTLYISHIDLEATALPAHSVTYKPGEGSGAWVVDADATEVADCPGTFTAPTGKVFNGWKNESDDSDVAVGAIVEDDMNLIAQWINHYAVTFNMNGHGDAIDPQDIKEGAKATRPDDPVEIGYDFGGWFTDNGTFEAPFDFNTTITAATPLYAKWTADPCSDKKSIVKIVMTAYNDAAVTGYNNNEYAGGKIINNLSNSSDNKNTYDFGDGEVTGYKLASSKSAIMATLAKGNFEYGDKIVVAVTNPASAQKLRIYAASDVDNVLLVKEIDAATAGIYEYKFTAAEIEAINDAGYKSIGVFRGDYNPFIYSVELKGCRSWAIMHTLTFKNIGGTATIAAESLEEGAYASTVAPTAPKIAMKRFKGWSESIGGSTVDLTTYTITEDKILYAVYEDIVCPTTGTVYKFVVKDGLASENLLTSTDKDMSSYVDVTGDGYLTYTATADNKATVNSDGTIQLKDATAAYLKVELECTLTAGDQIRSNISNNPMRVQVATTFDADDDLILAKNVYNTVDITSAMVGKNVLYIARSTNGNANIADFEIYRPAKFDVSFDLMGHGSAIADIEDVMEGSKITAPTAPTDVDYSFAGWYKENTLENAWDFDNDVVNINTTLYAKWLDKSDATLKSLKYGTTDIELEDGIYEYEIALPAATASVPALTAVTNNPAATAVVTDDDAFDGDGKATSTVEVTPQKEGAAHLTYTVNFTKLAELPQVNVTEATNWNFATAVAGSTTLENQTNLVLANVPGITNDATFNSQALKGSFNKMPGDYFQGTMLTFTTEVAGRLTIIFRGTNNNERHLKVYVGDGETEVADWIYQGNKTENEQTKSVFVPVGKVTLKAFEGSAAQNVRIYNMDLSTTADYERAVTEGRFGTICLPNGGVMVGAALFEVAYHDATLEKIFFDEILNGAMVAGRPYIFLPNDGVSALGVFYTDAANAPAGNYHGLYGSYTQHVLAQEAGNYILYNNQYMYVGASSSNVSVGANRAYFKIGVEGGIPTNAVAPLPGRRRVSMSAVRETPTGLENGELINGENGVQKVLINGELFILRGEKMYDATGRLVK